VHFQLRNLVCATTGHDVFVTHASDIQHYSYLTEQSTPVLSLHQLTLCRVQVSTMCVRGSIVLAGGFYGDMVCVRVPGDMREAQAAAAKGGSCGEVVFCERVTSDENAITNSIVLHEAASGALQAVISNNDCAVRVMDVEHSFAEIHKTEFNWAVNFTAIAPCGKLACVVGDATEAVIIDQVAHPPPRGVPRLTAPAGRISTIFAPPPSPDAGALVLPELPLRARAERTTACRRPGSAWWSATGTTTTRLRQHGTPPPLPY